MPNTLSRRPLVTFVLIFLAISALIVLFRKWLTQVNVQYLVLLTGNAILFLATLISFQLYRRSLLKSKVQHILTMVYGGIFAKMTICVVAAVAYILIARNSVDKIAIFACFGLYFIYSLIEVKILMQLSKGQKNG